MNKFKIIRYWVLIVLLGFTFQTNAQEKDQVILAMVSEHRHIYHFTDKKFEDKGVDTSQVKFMYHVDKGLIFQHTKTGLSCYKIIGLEKSNNKKHEYEYIVQSVNKLGYKYKITIKLLIRKLYVKSLDQPNTNFEIKYHLNEINPFKLPKQELYDKIQRVSNTLKKI